MGIENRPDMEDFPSYKPPFTKHGIFQLAMFDDTEGYHQSANIFPIVADFGVFREREGYKMIPNRG